MWSPAHSKRSDECVTVIDYAFALWQHSPRIDRADRSGSFRDRSRQPRRWGRRKRAASRGSCRVVPSLWRAGRGVLPAASCRCCPSRMAFSDRLAMRVVSDSPHKLVVFCVLPAEMIVTEDLRRQAPHPCHHSTKWDPLIECHRFLGVTAISLTQILVESGRQGKLTGLSRIFTLSPESLKASVATPR